MSSQDPGSVLIHITHISKDFTYITFSKATMATKKKAKHAIATAITANTEQPAAIPEHPQPVPVTPERSNRSTVTGKHPRDVTETKQDTHKTCPIVHTTWAAWKAAPTFPIRVTITSGGKFEKNRHGCY